MTDMSVTTTLKPDSLSGLAVQINDQHDRAVEHAKTSLEHARNTGELLQQAKKQVPHGQWLTWLSTNCKVSPRQSQRYLKVASNWTAITENDAASYLTIDKAIARTTAKPASSRTTWQTLIENIPTGKMLWGDFKNGLTIVFESKRSPGYFHLYAYFLSNTTDDGQAQETRRPMLPRAVAHLLDAEAYSPKDFLLVEQEHDWEMKELPQAGYPYSSHFGADIRNDNAGVAR